MNNYFAANETIESEIWYQKEFLEGKNEINISWPEHHRKIIN